MKKSLVFNRRDFLKLSVVTTFGLSVLPLNSWAIRYPLPPLHRKLGKTGFEVTTMGLGGKASLQHPPDDIDPVEIVRKAFEIGINYFDTSNLYGPSQLNMGAAFRQVGVVPGEENYNRRIRESVFITSKTHLRWGKGKYPDIEEVYNQTDGDHGEGAVADLKRSVSQIFGDGQGNYPEGVYLDMILAEDVNFMEEVDVLYKGLETPLGKDENFGAFVALRDYRDGTNYTGLNLKRERLVKHIGFSGSNASVMIEMIQRDEFEILDGLMVPVNINDRKRFNIQYNVIPVATAKNMAVIGTEIFDEWKMRDKNSRWSPNSGDILCKIGSKQISCRPFIEYALTTPGVHTVVIDIGTIDKDPVKCPLVQDFYAAQIPPDGMSEQQRLDAEAVGTFLIREGRIKYSLEEYQGLTAPQDIQLKHVGNTVNLSWAMAYAGENLISHYDILKNGNVVYKVEHKPLTTKVKMNYLDSSANQGDTYQVVTVDTKGNKKSSELFII